MSKNFSKILIPFFFENQKNHCKINTIFFQNIKKIKNFSDFPRISLKIYGIKIFEKSFRHEKINIFK